MSRTVFSPLSGDTGSGRTIETLEKRTKIAKNTLEKRTKYLIFAIEKRTKYA